MTISRRPFVRTYIDLWRRGPLLMHLAHCRNRRWRLRRLRCGTEPTSWRTRRMRAGFSIRAGWWLLSVGLFQKEPSMSLPPEPQPTPEGDGEPPPQPLPGEPEAPR